jgi:hypothetical protein
MSGSRPASHNAFWKSDHRREIAPAFIAMIEQKFSASPASRYVERG